MYLKDMMLQAIGEAGGPICDDCVWQPAGMKYRQQANSRGRQLAEGGLIRRGPGTCTKCGKRKTVSVLTGVELPLVEPASSDDKPWHWEGNVQSALATHLRTAGWRLLSIANTATKEAGVDIVAVDPEGSEWWITVKGYPERTTDKKTNPPTQARHWFAGALFDVVVYRTARRDIRIGVALPAGYKTYENLAKKSAWLHEQAKFRYFLVGEDGTVDTA